MGFGFDSRTNDYKLLIIEVEMDGSLIQPYLFSLNENCWNRVTAIPPNYTFDPNEVSAAFVNGAVHWLGYQTSKNGGFSNAILGFDLSAEEFFEISLPQTLIGLGPNDLSAMKYVESSIAVLKIDRANDGFDLYDLWVMKEYGVVESWTKVFTLHSDDQYAGIPRVFGFRKNGEVLLEVDQGKMASLDSNGQQMEPHEVEVATGIISFGGSYVESLVLLNKAVDVHSVSHVRTGPEMSSNLPR